MQARRVAARETANATKERYGRADLDALFAGARRVVVAKGKKVVEFELARGQPLTSEVADAILGPTGNLRAPAVRMGSTWLVGFLAEAWDETVG
jgi:hypothetical protein